MKISYVVFLVQISIVRAASIERRDASPCAVVSQSAASALNDAIGKIFWQRTRKIKSLTSG